MKNGLAKDWTEAFFAGIPGNLPEVETAIKKSAALNEKLAETAFHAAEDSIKLSAEWTKEALADLENLAKSQPEPTELVNVLAKYTSDAAGKSTQKVTALAEIMGRMQAETIRLFVEASNEAIGNQVAQPTNDNAAAKTKAKKATANAASA